MPAVSPGVIWGAIWEDGVWDTGIWAQSDTPPPDPDPTDPQDNSGGDPFPAGSRRRRRVFLLRFRRGGGL